MVGSTKVIVVFGKAITLDSLKHNCGVLALPDGYADLIWRSYWMKRNAGQDRTGALSEIVRICFSEDERRTLHGTPFKER